MRSALALVLLGLWALPAAAQNRGAPLVDGLGGRLGYGPDHDAFRPLDISPAFPAGLNLYGRALEPFFVSWQGALSGVRVDFDYRSEPFPQSGMRPPRIVPFEAMLNLVGVFEPGGEISPVMVALRSPARGAGSAGRDVARHHRPAVGGSRHALQHLAGHHHRRGRPR
ncbi:MAG: hypothetical protein H6703_00570 [Myxococcales bacterium]|nr:hypothetical protein [Myxococcales bacterium]